MQDTKNSISKSFESTVFKVRCCYVHGSFVLLASNTAKYVARKLLYVLFGRTNTVTNTICRDGQSISAVDGLVAVRTCGLTPLMNVSLGIIFWQEFLYRGLRQLLESLLATYLYARLTEFALTALSLSLSHAPIFQPNVRPGAKSTRVTKYNRSDHQLAPNNQAECLGSFRFSLTFGL